MSQFPPSVKYCVIGAGIHGLSTAWHLAKGLKAAGRGSGVDVVVLDKESVAAGASGIACGVVRNFYYQPAMGEVMRLSVELWESDPEGFAYLPVGYLAVAPDVQAQDLETIHERHQRTGYASTLVHGERQVFDYMRKIFPDWKARGLSALLHEHRGGFAFNARAIYGLADKAEAEGVRIFTGTAVTGFDLEGDGSVRTVRTNRGDLRVEHVVVAVGPWVKQLWEMLELPETVNVLTPKGEAHQNLPMWTYWQLQEGEIRFDPDEYATADGKIPPVLHVDSTEPLVSDRNGETIADGHWGIYFKRDQGGVQGGAVPLHIGHDAEVDPYGPDSPHYTADEGFADYWTAGLAHCMKRFEGCSVIYHRAPTGGLGCFTVDNFPVFDYLRSNAYVIADSNHGFKMIAVGQEVAKALLGQRSEVLHPFRFSRFAEGDLHPTSSSPFPWS